MSVVDVLAVVLAGALLLSMSCAGLVAAAGRRAPGPLVSVRYAAYGGGDVAGLPSPRPATG